MPYCIQRHADCWVLKMHGCVSHPENIILTREDQISFGEQHAALAGVVQTVLITRHVLFVGFSLRDDNFHRMASAVRRVVRMSEQPSVRSRPFDTVLVLERNPLIEELWGSDLQWISMSGPGREGPPARQLEIFLDYLLAQIRDESHLLDGWYQEVLTQDEKQLCNALEQLLGRLSPAARRAPAWLPVRRLLASLGAGKK